MVVVMAEGATGAQVEHVAGRLISMGFDVHRSTGAGRVISAPWEATNRPSPR